MPAWTGSPGLGGVPAKSSGVRLSTFSAWRTSGRLLGLRGDCLRSVAVATSSDDQLLRPLYVEIHTSLAVCSFPQRTAGIPIRRMAWLPVSAMYSHWLPCLSAGVRDTLLGALNSAYPATPMHGRRC